MSPRTETTPKLILTSNKALSFPRILSTGAAYGNHYTTEQMLQALLRNRKDDNNFDIEFATRVMKKCGFESHSVALANEQDLFRRFSRSEYLQHRQQNLMNLAERAANQALNSWTGGNRSQITHLLWGTMTGGMHAPGIDVKLVRRLHLSVDVERISLENMGCLSGFRLLNVARQIVMGDRSARVLVVSADLRSALGNSMPKREMTREEIVSVCLFRDAASSAIVGGCIPQQQPIILQQQQRQPAGYEIICGLSRILDDSHDMVNYFEGDDGSIVLQLNKHLPERIAKAEPDFVSQLLWKGKKLCADIPNDIGSFDILCHTGGPRVLEEVAKSLDVQDKTVMRWSWDVMTKHGNLSGASNLAVLDCHNRDYREPRAKWAICLSMGPGPCLEGVLLRSLHKKTSPTPQQKWQRRTGGIPSSPNPNRRKIIHIVGAGVAGITLAAVLDPTLYDVKIFEASSTVSETGYGLAIWPSTMTILREKLHIEDGALDIFSYETMTVRQVTARKHEIPLQGSNKGFMKRSRLLNCILRKALDRHPKCLHTGHKCQRVCFQTNGKVQAIYGTSDARLVTHECDLIVGADGVNSIVRKYVALTSDCRYYGDMTAYRFVVQNPSDALLEQTRRCWNISLGEYIHSPCYHISRDGKALNVVVLEYKGKPPDFPYKPSMRELIDVAQRSGMKFVLDIVKNERTITDLMCYSTYHIDCEPWHKGNSAVIIGDAAHAYGPLTAKMANLAINDAYTLGMMLNNETKKSCHLDNSVLKYWESMQRPKFETTRIRTLRHLQLYTPGLNRTLVSFAWNVFPIQMLSYFGSIFAYDYEVYEDCDKSRRLQNAQGIIGVNVQGIVGVKCADPLHMFTFNAMKYIFAGILFLATMKALNVIFLE